ncbi:hypothetical protein [Cysteiniphilum marinum]|uniref:hypothetical protein n=1 Tax=Cysteiniphilum marinum TaxID=2774191 RepID=UPI00193B80C0|nr:hypothetical protein [Cysteiniphilum marinum]
MLVTIFHLLKTGKDKCRRPAKIIVVQYGLSIENSLTDYIRCIILNRVINDGDFLRQARLRGGLSIANSLTDYVRIVVLNKVTNDGDFLYQYQLNSNQNLYKLENGKTR